MNGKSKAQDDANLKVLRELTHVPANRHCLDCGQRGPTYVNVTIGSFVCMTCSGLLRGLTPPHRVKSISMATFTAEEIEYLKSRGNEYCRKVWLATCSSKDSHIGAEKDPGRVEAIKSFMSSKYEQKRFYVDPARLSKSELSEIQAQTARALSSAASSSNSTGSLQKSPSLSSASSASSLSQNQSSPVLNNLRNNPQPNRLVNSITLPDIKPLSSLIGPVTVVGNGLVSSGDQNGQAGKNAGPNPISFINNLSNPQSLKINNNNSNTNNLNGPWSSGGGAGGVIDNFNANFADFDDAFNSNGAGNDACSSSNMSALAAGLQKDMVTNNSAPSVNNFANFNSLQQPLLPCNGISSSVSSNPVPSNITLGGGSSSEDRYAALKDLDSLFKQNFENGDSAGLGTSPPVQNGFPISMSVPANLSSAASPPNAWLSASNQNPFSQTSSHGTANGWSINGSNGTGANPHNPFSGGSSWQSPQLSNAGNATISLFPSQMNSCGGPNATFGNNQSCFGQPSNNIFGMSSFGPGAPNGKINPFFGNAPGQTSNPNNPFL